MEMGEGDRWGRAKEKEKKEWRSKVSVLPSTGLKTAKGEKPFERHHMACPLYLHDCYLHMRLDRRIT